MKSDEMYQISKIKTSKITVKNDEETGKIIACALEIHRKWKDTLTEKQYQSILYDKLSDI